nr:type VI secretion system baseplate subunit TssF [uncultured Holophaga sp.]
MDELLPFYERELGILHQLLGEFAEEHPKIARRLQIDGEQCEDPAVERLVQGFAFLAAPIHQRLADEFPEVSEPLLQRLAPGFIRPFPATSILQVALDPEKPEISQRYRVPRHASVLSPSRKGIPCRFRTCSELEVWPVVVTRVKLLRTLDSEFLSRRFPVEALLEVELEALGSATLQALKLDRLRFFLDGEASLMNLLHELLCSRLKGIEASDGSEDPARSLVLPPSALRPMGLEPEDALLGPDSFGQSGHQLLAEYFACPEKHLFLELSGLDHPRLLHPGARLRLRFLLTAFGTGPRQEALLRSLGPDNLKLGCVPIINLFTEPASPIQLAAGSSPYPITTPTGRKNPEALEIHSVDDVLRVEEERDGARRVAVPWIHEPARHSREDALCWRTAGTGGPTPTLELVDLEGRTTVPGAGTLLLQVTCTNRDLAAELPFDDSKGEGQGWTFEHHAALRKAAILRRPSPSLRPHSRQERHWPLIAQVCRDHLSTLHQGPESLRESFALHLHRNPGALRSPACGLTGTSTRTVSSRFRVDGEPILSRGTEVSLTFDEDSHPQTSPFLLTCILERFFVRFCPPNSFIRMRLLTRQRGEIRVWPPRPGEGNWV